MTNPDAETPIPRHNCVSDSPYTEYFYDDMEGDTTIRPIPPERLQQAIAERDMIWECLARRKAKEEAAKQAKPEDEK